MKLTKKYLESRMVKGKIMLPNMKITEIEAFPNKVKEIYLDGNRLCYLPKIPEGVEVLIMRGNPLHEEPNLPESIKCADFTDTCLVDELYFDVRYAVKEALTNTVSIDGENESLEERMDNGTNSYSDWEHEENDITDEFGI